MHTIRGDFVLNSGIRYGRWEPRVRDVGGAPLVERWTPLRKCFIGTDADICC